MTVTLEQRKAAQTCIQKLQETLTRPQIAERLGLRLAYASFAAGMTTRTRGYQEEYILPADAVQQILAFAETQ